MRIFLGTAIAVIILTVPLFLLPHDGILLTAYIFALLGVFALSGSLYWGWNRTEGEYVTTAAFPLAAWGYLATNLLFSIIIVLLHTRGTYSLAAGWFCFLHLIFAGFFAWKILAMDAGKDEIEQVEINVKQSISNWKMLHTQIASIAVRADSSVRKEVESVRDAMRYADPVTSPQLQDIELAIQNNVDNLADAVVNHNSEEVNLLVQELRLQIRQRSEMCKMLK